MRIRNAFQFSVAVVLTSLSWILTGNLDGTVWVFVLAVLLAIQSEILLIIRQVKEGERLIRHDGPGVIDEYLQDTNHALPLLASITSALAGGFYYSHSLGLGISQLLGYSAIFFAATTSTLPPWVLYFRSLREAKKPYHPTLIWSLSSIAVYFAMASISTFISIATHLNAIESTLLVTTPLMLSAYALYKQMTSTIWFLEMSGPEQALVLLEARDVPVDELAERLRAKLREILDNHTRFESRLEETAKYSARVINDITPVSMKYNQLLLESRVTRQPAVPGLSPSDQFYLGCKGKLFAGTVTGENQEFRFLGADDEVPLVIGQELAATTRFFERFTKDRSSIQVSQLLTVLAAPIVLLRLLVLRSMPALTRRNLNDWFSSVDSMKKERYLLQLDLDITAVEDRRVEQIESKYVALRFQIQKTAGSIKSCEAAYAYSEVFGKLMDLESERALIWERRAMAARGLAEVDVAGADYILRTSESIARTHRESASKLKPYTEM